MSDAKRTGCGCLVVTGGATVLVAAISFAWYFGDVQGVQTLHSLDESSYDPIAGFQYAERLVESEAEFIQMSAEAVRADGTVDLTADDEPTVNYQWRRGTKLLVVTASAFGFSRAVGATRVTSNQSGAYYRLNLGYRLSELPAPDLGSVKILGEQMNVLQPIPAPTCDFGALRIAAAQNGAPATGNANVVYRTNFLGGGALYQVSAKDTDVLAGSDCKPIQR